MVLTFGLGRISWQIRDYFLFSTKNLNRMLRQSLFLDVLRRDIICASPDPAFWDKNNFIFRKSGYLKNGYPVDIGFFLKDGKIFRINGVYDFDKKAWIKKSSSLIFLSKFNLKSELKIKETLVVGVKIQKLYIRLRNGKV